MDVASMQRISELSNLLQLDISHCKQLSNEGLAYLKACRRLQYLNISSTELLSDCVPSILDLHFLLELNIYSTEIYISDKDLRRLPYLKVVKTSH